jgi:hypothetical protein
MNGMLDEDIDMEGGTPTGPRDLWHSQQRIHAFEQQSSPSPISSHDNVLKVDSAFINMKPR